MDWRNAKLEINLTTITVFYRHIYEIFFSENVYLTIYYTF